MTTPSTSAQGPVACGTTHPAHKRAREIARSICVEYRLSPERYEASGSEHPIIPVIVRHVAPALTASPSPAASPSPSGVRVKPLEWDEYETEGELDRWDAETALGSFYEISAEFDGYHVSHDHTHMAARFDTPDEAKAAAQADYEARILSALASDATPAPTSGPEEIAQVMSHKWLDPECAHGGCQSLVWKGRYEAAVKGRQAFRQAYRNARSALAKPASEPAGGDVREALRWVEQNLAAAKRAMKTSAEHSDGRSNFAAHDAHKHLSTIAAALSSSAVPAEPVAWTTQAQMMSMAAGAKSAHSMWPEPRENGAALYAHPAPATVEMREAIEVLIADMRAHVDENDETAMILPRAQFNRYVGKLARIAALAPATEGRKS